MVSVYTRGYRQIYVRMKPLWLQAKVWWCYFDYNVILFSVLKKPKGHTYFKYECNIISDISHVRVQIFYTYGIKFLRKNDFYAC